VTQSLCSTLLVLDFPRRLFTGQLLSKSVADDWLLGFNLRLCLPKRARDDYRDPRSGTNGTGMVYGLQQHPRFLS
jgi:hypothetical protein